MGAAKVLLCGPVPDLLDLVADNIDFDVLSRSPVLSIAMLLLAACLYLGVSVLTWLRPRAGVLQSRASENTAERKLNVGLVWRGNPAYGMDVHRSIAFTEFCPCLTYLEPLSIRSKQAIQDLRPQILATTALSPISSPRHDMAKHSETDPGFGCHCQRRYRGSSSRRSSCKPVFMLATNACDWRWNRNSQDVMESIP